MQLLFKSFLWLLLKSALGLFARYGHHETISRRPEQMYHLPQDWNGLGRGHYSSPTRVNAGGLECSHYLSQLWAIIEARPGPSFRYGTHQTNGGRIEQVYLPADPRLE